MCIKGKGYQANNWQGNKNYYNCIKEDTMMIVKQRERKTGIKCIKQKQRK